MRYLLYALFLVLPAVPTYAQIHSIYLGVEGISCHCCTRWFVVPMLRIPGVQDIQLDVPHGTFITWDPQLPFSITPIISTFHDSGYRLTHCVLEIEGIIKLENEKYYLHSTPDTTVCLLDLSTEQKQLLQPERKYRIQATILQLEDPLRISQFKLISSG